MGACHSRHTQIHFEIEVPLECLLTDAQRKVFHSWLWPEGLKGDDENRPAALRIVLCKEQLEAAKTWKNEHWQQIRDKGRMFAKITEIHIDFVATWRKQPRHCPGHCPLRTGCLQE